MNDTPDNKPSIQSDVEIARERTKQATVAGWTAGVVGVVALWNLTGTDSWPHAAGVAAVAAMVAYACHRILPR